MTWILPLNLAFLPPNAPQGELDPTSHEVVRSSFSRVPAGQEELLPPTQLDVRSAPSRRFVFDLHGGLAVVVVDHCSRPTD